MLHDIYNPNFSAKILPITIGDYVWGATGVVVLNNINIGKGDIVTKDILSYEVWDGVPAKKNRRKKKAAML